MEFKGLSHIGVMVESCERSEKFYTENLGFEKAYDYVDGALHLMFLKNGDCTIEFIERPGLDRKLPGRTDHVALSVKGIGEIVEGLKNRGVLSKDASVGEMPLLYGGSKSIFFEGPDGERIELFEILNS